MHAPSGEPGSGSRWRHFNPEALRLQLQDLLATLRNWPWFETLRTLRERFSEDRLGLTAGSLTFTTLIALVPLVTVMLAAFTAFPMFASMQAALQKYFLQSLVPDSIAAPVLQGLTQFAGQARRLGTAGILLLLATALALMLTIDRTLNAIWRVRKARPLAQRILVYWAALTLGPLALGLSLSVTSYALSANRGLVAALPGGVSLLLDSLEFGLLAMAAAATYHYVPNTPVRWRHAWAGGIFVALAFELAKAALGWYLRSVPTYSVLYGAFATAPILLLWTYLVWVVVLLGAVVAAYAPSLQARVVRRPLTPGWRFEIALALLQPLAQARDTPERGLSLAALARRLRADPLQLEPVLEGLLRIDWVAQLDEPDARQGPRLVLLCDPASTSLAPLADALLLPPNALTDPFRRAAQLERLTLAQALGLKPSASPA
jgi:membrane protein